MFYLIYCSGKATIPGVEAEVVGMIGIDNRFQDQPRKRFAEGFNHTIGIVSLSVSAVLCVRPTLRIASCFIAQNNSLLVRLPARNSLHKLAISQKCKSDLACLFWLFPLPMELFFKLHVNGKGPTDSVGPRDKYTPSNPEPKSNEQSRFHGRNCPRKINANTT
jgi:hypothetical protein